MTWTSHHSNNKWIVDSTSYENALLNLVEGVVVMLAWNYLCNQHYVIKFVSDLWQVGGFLWVLRFPPPIKLTVTV